MNSPSHGVPDARPLVCFVHGLEGTPQGAKVIGMRAQGLHVMAPNMHMSLWNVRRKNAAVRSILRLPEVRALGVAGVLSAAISRHTRSILPLVGWGALTTGWALMSKRELSRRGLASSFEVCLELVARDIQARQPDVIVGSSWGGAVCMELVRQGRLHTPMILLAPAYRKVGEHLGWTDIAHREAQIRSKMARMDVEIFHDPADDVIPFAHSHDFVAGTAVKLYGLSAGGHSLLGLIEDGSLVRSIHGLHRGHEVMTPLQG